MPSPCYLNPPGEPSFNEILITTVRQYPALYSNARRAFENVDRNKIWEEVAAKIERGVTGEFAKKRWLQLRDRYRKELKLSIAQNFSQPQKWSHFQLLTWLDPYLQGAIPITSNGSAPCYTLDGINTSTNGDAFYEDFAVKLSSVESPGDVAESTLSDCFDDVKPALSTLQSVLAVAEANLKKDAAADPNEKEFLKRMENGFESEMDSDVNLLDSRKFNGTASKQSSERASTSLSQQPGASGQDDDAKIVQLPSDSSRTVNQESQLRASSVLSVLGTPNMALSPCTSDTGLEEDEVPHTDISIGTTVPQECHSGTCVVSCSDITVSPQATNSSSSPAVVVAQSDNPVTFKTSASHSSRCTPYRLPIYSSVRFRSRNMKKQQKQQQLDSAKVSTQNGMKSASANIINAEWINDEEMLFARIIGLRLKKMSLVQKRTAQMKILQFLDNCEEKVMVNNV